MLSENCLKSVEIIKVPNRFKFGTIHILRLYSNKMNNLKKTKRNLTLIKPIL